jgi:hypothetical protein
VTNSFQSHGSPYRKAILCTMTIETVIVRNDVDEAISTFEDHGGPITAIVVSMADHASS